MKAIMKKILQCTTNNADFHIISLTVSVVPTNLYTLLEKLFTQGYRS